MYGKKNYAFNKKGEKLFCKTTLSPMGVLFVDYYIPNKGFSIIWEKGELVRISGVNSTVDGRKTIVTYMVHPSCWMGTTFRYPIGSIQTVINDIFEKYININI